MHLCFCSVRCCKAHRKRFLLYQTRGATPSEIRISFVVTLIVLRLFYCSFSPRMMIPGAKLGKVI